MEMTPFKNRIYISSPTMHGDELSFMTSAYENNWMSTVGENIRVIEREIGQMLANQSAVALSSGTAALHLAMRLAGVKPGDTVFCSDLTFAATVNPVIYEGATPVLIDSERDSWNMNPKALEKAFSLYPDTKVVAAVDLYGVPAKLREIREICDAHGAILIEDAAEAFGAAYEGRATGTYGSINVISFNGNKVITGSTGGMLLGSENDARKARKWSTQSRDGAPWYQHTELGFNYRISNVIAGVVRGQLPYLREHIERKKAIYERYKEAFKDLPLTINPYVEETMTPSFWLSCALIDEGAMCEQRRSEMTASYIKTPKKSCPTEILEKLEAYNIEGRPLWKPMHLQPIYATYPFVTAEDNVAVTEDLFDRGLCLPSDIKMTAEQQGVIIELIRSCFEGV